MFGKKPAVQKKKQRDGMPAWLWMFIGSFFTLMVVVFLYLWQPFQSSDIETPRDGLQVNNDDPAAPAESTAATENAAQQPTTGTKQPSEDQSQEKAQYEFYDLLPEQQVTPVPDKAIAVTNTKTQTQQKADVTLKLPTEAFDNDATFTPEDTYDGPESSPTQTSSTSVSDKPTGDTPATNKPTSNKPTQNKPTSAAATTSNTKESVDPIEAMIAKDAAQQQSQDKSYILQVKSFLTSEEADRRRVEVLLAGVDATVVKSKDSNDRTLYKVISERYSNKSDAFAAQQRLETAGIDALVVERK